MRFAEAQTLLTHVYPISSPFEANYKYLLLQRDPAKLPEFCLIPSVIRSGNGEGDARVLVLSLTWSYWKGKGI